MSSFTRSLRGWGVVGTSVLFAVLASSTRAEAEVPLDATQVCPVLVGTPAPAVPVRTARGVEVNLADLLAERPTLLIFYRGGWCPYCNRHLGELQEIAERLVGMGIQIVGLSPDRPDLLPRSIETHGLSYSLYSDSDMTAARAFGVAFQLSDEQFARLKELGHDLEATSGATHHELPVPSAFLVGKDRTIEFSYVNPNYRTRIEPAVVLAAAETALAEWAEESP